jgi:hypothetical protein
MVLFMRLKASAPQVFSEAQLNTSGRPCLHRYDLMQRSVFLDMGDTTNPVRGRGVLKLCANSEGEIFPMFHFVRSVRLCHLIPGRPEGMFRNQ